LGKIHLYELSTIEDQIRGESESTFFHPSEVELNRTISALIAEVERVKPARVVFDSLSEMRMLADTPLRYRRQILQLKQFFAGRNCTVLMLDDRTSAAQDLQVESIAHGVICLSSQPQAYGVALRQLNVLKIRGSKFREGSHDLILRRGGLTVFPRLVSGEHHRDFVREDFPSGIKEFRRPPVGIKILLVDFETDALRIRVALRPVVHRADDALRFGKLRRDRIANIGCERGDAASAGDVIAEKGDVFGIWSVFHGLCRERSRTPHDGSDIYPPTRREALNETKNARPYPACGQSGLPPVGMNLPLRPLQQQRTGED
jgi:hypothetical protein